MTTDLICELPPETRLSDSRILGLICLMFVVCSMWLPSLAHAATATSTWPAGQVATQTANIPSPPNTQVNTFTGTSGPWNYVLYPFTVSASGTYTATSATARVVNTTWVVKGNFVPGVPMGTPLADHFAGVLGTAGSNPYTGTFTNLPLVAGQQYTMVVAYDIGTVAGDLSTVAINGPGCIALGGAVCSAASIPTLSEWGVLAMALLLAIAGVFIIRRRAASTG